MSTRTLALPFCSIVTLALLLVGLTGCETADSSMSPMAKLAATETGGAVRGDAQPGPQVVTMPRTYLTASEALTVANRQTGLLYAVVPAQFGGVVGPYRLDEPLPLATLVEQVAKASDTNARLMAGAVVFEGKTPADTTDAAVDAVIDALNAGAAGAPQRLADAPDYMTDVSLSSMGSSGKSIAKLPSPEALKTQVYRLGRLCQARVIVPLSRLTSHEDEQVRLTALRALRDMEGDFMRAEWPGRVSIFELLVAEMDTQSLLWAVEEGGPEGGLVWDMAVDVLGRARLPVLSRQTWWTAWRKTPGAMQRATWAIGRVDDPSAARSIRGRLANTFSDVPEDAYLAGMALARIDPSRLKVPFDSKDPEARRAAAFGAGFAPADSSAARSIIAAGLDDADPVVQFLACQSAARVGGEDWIARLIALAGDAKRSVSDRAAAVTALAAANDPAATKAVLAAVTDSNPGVRATAARVLAELGGTSARNGLVLLLNDADPGVRAEAAMSLGRLGDPGSIRLLGGVLADAATPADVRIAAIIGLGRGRNPLAAEPLAQVVLNPDEPDRVRRYAIRATAELSGHAGASVLKSIVPLTSPLHDYEAVRYLDLPNPADTARMLIPLLTGGGRSDSASAACRLSDLGYGPGVRELCEGFDVFDNSTRMMHMWGAIRSAGDSATDSLLEASRSRRDSIRQVAALALGSRPNPKVVARLIELCDDENGGVRKMAAQSLGLTGDPAAIPTLIRLAKGDPSIRVSHEAVRSLRRRDWVGRPEVKAAFAELAGTPRDAGVPNPSAPSLREQPGNSFVLRRWPAEYDDYTITNITYESSLTYDSDKGRIVQWGAHGRRADFPQTGQTWFYDTAANTWQRLHDTRQWPNGQCLTWGTTYDSANRMVVSPTSGHGGHGWINSLRVNMSHSVPWVLDTTRDQWRPARPPINTGYAMGQVQGLADPEHDVVIFHHGPMWAYDGYENRWDKLGSGLDRPAYGAASTWDPVTNRMIALVPGGVGGMATWAYDPAANTWTDLKAQGGPKNVESRLVYDSANDVMLAFAANPERYLRTWVYHLRENRWEELPMVYPAPCFGSIDCAYDSKNNVVVFSGGWESGFSGELTQRETWTYRYKPADGKAKANLPGHLSATLTTAADGQVKITWTPARGAKSHRVLRGLGERPWQAKLQPSNVAAGDGEFHERVNPAKDDNAYFYRVEALGADGKVIARSNLLRTRPQCVPDAWAVNTGKGVQVGWKASPSGDVAGYRVYRAEVDLGNPWRSKFESTGLDKKLVLVSGDKPVEGTSFLDKAARPSIDGRANEMNWPKTFVYVIRPVNAMGVEGGYSPSTLALPDVPGPVRVVPWADGKRLVLWTPPPGQGVAGYHVMRMDDWIGESVYRYNGAPVVTAGFYDDEQFPRADRRRYYVVGVDETGALGTPSSGAWSHGFP